MRSLLVLLALAPLFRVADARIDEASGIARGIRSPGVVYVQNDSGDTARFFALDLHTGATVATIAVPGATNVDWEDLAVATDAAGTPSVWLGDIGDNGADRAQIQLYRVDEPAVAGRDRGRTIRANRPDVWHLRYPDGPHNAEGLAVAAGGRAYLVTKSAGVSDVFLVPSRPSAQVQTLTRIATIRFDGILPLATGAALSRDGRLFAVRTYTDAYVWTVTGGDVAAALRTSPRHIVLPSQRQGEGIAIDGDRLLVDSEGEHQPVYAVPLAAVAAASSSPAPVASSAAVATPSTGASARPRGGHSGRAWVAGGAAVGVAVVVGGVVALRRRRHAAG